MLASHKAEPNKKPTFSRAVVLAFLAIGLLAVGLLVRSLAEAPDTPAMQDWDRNEESYQKRDVQIVSVMIMPQGGAHIKHVPVNPQPGEDEPTARDYYDPDFFGEGFLESMQVGDIVGAWNVPGGDMLRPPRPAGETDLDWYPYCFYGAAVLGFVFLLELERVLFISKQASAMHAAKNGRSMVQSSMIKLAVLGILALCLFALGVFSQTDAFAMETPATQRWDRNEENLQKRDVRILEINPNQHGGAYIKYEYAASTPGHSTWFGRYYEDQDFVDSIRVGDIMVAWISRGSDELRPPRPVELPGWTQYCFYAAGGVLLAFFLEIGRVIIAGRAAQKA